MHEHNWIVETIINMPEDRLGRCEVWEMCECGEEQIRVVRRDRVVVVNPN